MYLNAVLSLARLRRLALPDIVVQHNGQINVAHQQMNVMESHYAKTEEDDPATSS